MIFGTGGQRTSFFPPFGGLLGQTISFRVRQAATDSLPEIGDVKSASFFQVALSALVACACGQVPYPGFAGGPYATAYVNAYAPSFGYSAYGLPDPVADARVAAQVAPAPARTALDVFAPTPAAYFNPYYPAGLYQGAFYPGFYPGFAPFAPAAAAVAPAPAAVAVEEVAAPAVVKVSVAVILRNLGQVLEFS